MTQGTKVKRAKNLLVADDEPAFRLSAALALRTSGYTVTETGNGHEAFFLILDACNGGREPFDLLITDIRMPALSGLELLDALHEIGCPLPVLVMTGFLDLSLETELNERDYHEYIEKPFEPAELIRRVRSMLAPADGNGLEALGA